MPARIRVLDDALVDQIAAGEVVERPASVVKELVENALDAGARTIRVDIEDGGTSLVRVTDDGTGMSRQDAALAVRRHATSKIRRVEDLSTIATLGFRGEALPSMASVSRFSLLTREADAVAGTRVRISGGGAPEVVDVGCAPGTVVEVRDLFFNVPARRKFLRAKATESGHVSQVCLRTALSRPELRLVLCRNGRKTTWLPAEDLAARARQTFADQDLTVVEGIRDGVGVAAFLSAPERARSGASGLHVFVNGRAVRDRALSRAVAFAYGSVLPPGRYPVGLVHLTLDPSEVDVNVHPQKSEVRFGRSRSVHEALTRLLASRLGTAAWTGGVSSRDPAFWSRRLGAAAAAPPLTGAPASAAGDPWGLSGVGEPVAPAWPPAGPSPRAASPGPATRPLPGFGGRFASLRVLGQVRRMLIVCEGADGLHLIDQHAADERVRFARLKRAHEAADVATQRLLFPERVELGPELGASVESLGECLLALGIECRMIGETTAAVHAVPALVRRAPPGRLLLDVLDELGRTGDRAFGDAVDTALSTMACHGAIRAGDELAHAECEALLRALDEVEDFSGHCPHGRPVVMSVGFGEIERKLGR